MKSLFRNITLLLTFALSLSASAQVKISQMPALSTGLDSAELPVIKNSVNYRVSGGKFIISQFSKAQQGGAWVDSLRVGSFASGPEAAGRNLNVSGFANFTTKTPYRSYAPILDNYDWKASTVSIGDYLDSVDMDHSKLPLNWPLQVHRIMINREQAKVNGGWGYHNIYPYHLMNAAWFRGQLMLDTSANPYNVVTSSGADGVVVKGQMLLGPSKRPAGGQFYFNAPNSGEHAMTVYKALTQVDNSGGMKSQLNGKYTNYFSFLYNNGTVGDSSYIDRFYHFNAGMGRLTGRVKHLAAFYANGLQQGYIDRAYGVFIEGADDLNYFAGKLMVGDSSLLNADAHKMYVAGSAKITGNILGAGRTLLGAGVTDDGVSALQVRGNIGIGATLADSSSGVISQAGKRIFSTYGTNNYFIGQSGNFTMTGSENVSIGNATMTQATSAKRNIAIGTNVLDSNQTGNANVAIGWNVLNRNRGGRNVAIGYAAMQSLSDAAGDNTAVGTWALEYLQSGTRNTGVGEDVGANMSTGSNNTHIGYRAAGDSYQAATLNQTIAIGVNHNLTGTVTNTTVIGNYISTDRSNVVLLGRSDQKVIISGTQFALLGNFTPASSADAAGEVGDIAKDDNYIYIKTASGWKRSALTAF